MKTKVMFNKYILDHDIKTQYNVIEGVQDQINLGQKIGPDLHYEKQLQNKNRDEMEGF